MLGTGPFGTGPVGIVVNPRSGTDVRRAVAAAGAVTVDDKTYTVVLDGHTATVNGRDVAFDVAASTEPTSEADGYKVEKRYFAFSLLYLFLHFGAILAEAALRPWGLGGW